MPELLQRRSVPTLRALERMQLVQRMDGVIGPEEDLRFHHVLIRDAAYGRVLKRTRAELHERFVDWADAHNGTRDRGLESEEVLGYHLEQAHRYLSELGPLGEHGLSSRRARIRATGVGRSPRIRARRHAGGGQPAATRCRAARGGNATSSDPPDRRGGSADRSRRVDGGGPGSRERHRGGSDHGSDPLSRRRRELSSSTSTTSPGDPTGDGIADQVEQAIVVLEAANDQKGLTRAWRTLTNIHFAACRFLDAETRPVG